jgi:hypothetical protein
MLGRVVITSVPRGLDGGAGFQAVLRTQGLQPSIAERLASRAAYPHPFPFGDPRNPHVLFHRIERVGDRTIHILGSVRDAGASYTGRSNHLAELIAIDPAETRSLPGGPAFAARSFPWLGRWTGEPRAVPLADEAAIPAYDPDAPETTRRPADCAAWEKATGDAGWAGELAQSFLDGRRALIWAGDPVNVLELFTEALRLLPASVRWQVTFNTCEIEPFPAHWRAVRPELGLVGNYEPTNELRLVLGKIRESRSRAPDHDLSRQARGEAPVRETRSAPSFDRGHESLTQQDDAALRKRLREISETRRRRTGPAVDARQVPRLPGMRRILILGALALFGIGALLGTGIVPARVRSSRIDRIDDPSMRPSLRSTEEERERKEQLVEEKKRAEIQAERAKAVARAQAEAKRAEDARTEKERAAERAEAQRAEDARTKAERVFKEEKTKEQKNAIQKLAAKATTTVSLIDTKSRPDLSLDQAATRRSVELCDGFDINGLISPSLELASPYNDADRLRVGDRSDTVSGEPTWPIFGTIFVETEGTRTKDLEAGRIVAREGKLFLEFATEVPNPTLFSRLQNSVLVISSRDPDGDRNLTTRREIWLAQPVKSPSPYLLDPLSKDDEFPVPIRERSLSNRIEDMPLSWMSWKVELRHPAFDEPFILTHDAMHKEPHDDEPQELRLLKPATGLDVRYHAIDAGGDFLKCSETMQCVVTVKFTPSGFQCRREIRGLKSDVLRDIVKIDRLRMLRDKSGTHSDELLQQGVQEALIEALSRHPDKTLASHGSTLKKLQWQYDTIPAPGSNASTAPNNPDYRAKYESDRNKIKDMMTPVEQAYGTRLGERNEILSRDANALVEALSKAASCLQPIEARIKEITATATAESGKSYRIPIVE